MLLHYIIKVILISLLYSLAHANSSSCQDFFTPRSSGSNLTECLYCDMIDGDNMIARLDSVKPYARKPNEPLLSDYTLRFIEQATSTPQFRRLTSTGGVFSRQLKFKVEDVDFYMRSLLSDVLSSGRKSDSFFINDNAGNLNYVQAASNRDMALIEASNVHGRPSEVFQFRRLTNRNSTISSDIHDGKNGSRIPVSLVNEVLNDFMMTSGTLMNRILYGKLKVLAFVHSHPIYEHILDLTNASMDMILPLSRGDRIAAIDMSKEMPNTPILMVAVLPNGYKYSALFLNGKDITEDIRRYLN